MTRNDEKLKNLLRERFQLDQPNDPAIQLESYIVANTSSATMQQLWGKQKEEIEANNVLFQEEDKGDYIGRMLGQTL
jgi:hypothetical protein